MYFYYFYVFSCVRDECGVIGDDGGERGDGGGGGSERGEV